jgi:phosphonate transport system substrate-binding protein
MSFRQLVLLLIPFILLIFAGIIIMPSHETESVKESGGIPANKQVVTLGTLTSDIPKMEAVFAPFLRHLNAMLEEDRVELQILYFSSLESLYAALDREEVDFFVESSFPVYMAVKDKGMRAIARQWKNGVKDYHCMIAVRADSQIFSLPDMKGKVLAVEDHTSSSSFFLPLAEIKAQGINPVEIPGSPDPLSSSSMGYRFSGKEAVSIEWVLDGSVDAAAISTDFFAEQAPETFESIRIIHETPAIPRYLLASRQGLNSKLEDRILDLLLTLETYPEGQKALRGFWNTRRFDLIPYESDLRERMFVMIDTF